MSLDYSMATCLAVEGVGEGEVYLLNRVVVVRTQCVAGLRDRRRGAAAVS